MVRPDSVDLVPRLVWHFDEPFADSSAIPTYLVSQFAAQHVKVVLTGDGGDEFFAGYPNFLAVERHREMGRDPTTRCGRSSALSPERCPYRAYGKNFLWMISRPTPLERYFEFVYTQHYLSRNLLNDPWMMPLEERELRRAFADCLLDSGADRSTQALYFEATANLTGDMLVKVDRMSMANSLEVRCPMLDHELAGARRRHSAQLEDPQRQGKYCFIEAMKNRLPEVVWNRPKRGFSVPIREWLRGPLARNAVRHADRPTLPRTWVRVAKISAHDDPGTHGRPAGQPPAAVGAADAGTVVPAVEGCIDFRADAAALAF